MCGITAISRVVGRSSISDPRQFMRLAALAIEPRGKDATGFAWTTPSGESYFWKTPGRALEVVSGAPLDLDMLNVIGHTRWKTQGDVKDNRNNHPVIDDGVLLVHNGTVDNDYELYRWLGKDFVPKAEVDSQVIATMLANKAEFLARETTDVLEVLEGSAALAWIETDMPEILHLARVHHRPLTIGWTRLGDMVMSSTPETLHNLAVLANTKIRNVWEVPEGRYITVQEGEIVNVEEFTPKPDRYTWGGASTTKKYTKHPTTTTTPVTTTTTPNGTLISHDKPGSNVVPFDQAAAEKARREAEWAEYWAAKDAEDEAYWAAREGRTELIGRIEDGRWSEPDGTQWIPVYDGDEVTDWVILDADGKFIALANSDDYAIEADLVEPR